MRSSLLFAPLLAAVAASFIATNVSADQDQATDPVAQEAIKQATSTFSTYLTECNGKTYGQLVNSLTLMKAVQYVEFSGPLKAVSLQHQWRLEESDQLNGITWLGTIKVELGQSARLIVPEFMGASVKDWESIRELTFKYQLKNGKWELANAWGGKKTLAIDLPFRGWKSMMPGLSCKQIPKYDS